MSTSRPLKPSRICTLLYVVTRCKVSCVFPAGKRIHIGQVLQWATSLGCRTNSGKDYCIIWLNPATLEPSSSSTKSRVTVPSQQHELWAASKLRTISAATLTARMQQIQQYIQQQQPKPAASAKLQQQQQRRDTAASPPTWDNVARSALQDNDDVRGRSPFAGVRTSAECWS